MCGLKQTQAPEGGWGWMVALGMAFVLIVSLGPMICFGLIFGDFLEGLGEGTSGVTLINSVYMTIHSFTGLLTNFALSKYSCRQVALVGSILFFTGNFLTAFAQSVTHMIFTFGVLPGIGLGLMIPAAYTCFNTYFVQRRVFVMGLAQTFLSAGIMGYPLVVEKLVSTYGFRGAQAVVAALTLHATLGAIAFFPLKKKVIQSDLSENFLPAANKLLSNVRIHAQENGISKMDHNKAYVAVPFEEKGLSNKELEISQINLKDALHNKLNLLGPDVLETEDVKADSLKMKDDKSLYIKTEEEEEPNHLLILSEDKPHESYQINCVDIPRKKRRSSSVQFEAFIDNKLQKVRSSGDQKRNARMSIISLGSVAGAIVGNSGTLAVTKQSRNCWNAVVNFLDLSLLKDPVYTSLNLGVSFSFYSDFTFMTLLPLFLLSLGYSRTDTAIFLTVAAASDLVGRIMYTLQGAYLQVSSRAIFLIGSAFIFLGRTVMIYAHTYGLMIAVNAFHGFFRSWIHATFSLVFAEHCSLERFPSAYGLYMAVSGVIGIASGPAIGLIRDVTNSYPICIHALNIQILLCVIPWSLELLYRYFLVNK